MRPSLFGRHCLWINLQAPLYPRGVAVFVAEFAELPAGFLAMTKTA